MDVDNKEVASFSPTEVDISSSLVQELFNEGEKAYGGLYNNSAAEYFDEYNVPTTRPILDQKFAPLVFGTDPSHYFLAYYDDRRDKYFSDDTRGQEVCLSTSPGKYASNDRLQEITYKTRNA